MAVPGFRGLSLGEFWRRFSREFVDNACTDVAAQLSYYFLFALFPLLFFLVTLTAYLPLQTEVAELLDRIRALMPHEALGLIERQLDSLLRHPRPNLLTAGLVVALWSASRGVDALRTALNRAYDVKESRPWWRTQALALLMTVATSVLVLASMAMILAGGRAGFWVADRIHFGHEFLLLWSWLRWPTTALVIMLAVALAYYVLPDVVQRFRYVTPGSVTATLLWLLSTWGFTQYVDHFGKYDVTYGSIGGAVVLLLWLYVSALVFIVGGEVNAVIEHASPGGKRRGSRAPSEAPPPPWKRASAAPPGAAKAAEPARRSEARGCPPAHTPANHSYPRSSQ
jgi:membrane protein